MTLFAFDLFTFVGGVGEVAGGRKSRFKANALPSHVRNDHKHLDGYNEPAWVPRADLLKLRAPSAQIPFSLGPQNYMEACVCPCVCMCAHACTYMCLRLPSTPLENSFLEHLNTWVLINPLSLLLKGH